MRNSGDNNFSFTKTALLKACTEESYPAICNSKFHEGIFACYHKPGTPGTAGEFQRSLSPTHPRREEGAVLVNALSYVLYFMRIYNLSFYGNHTVVFVLVMYIPRFSSI